MKKIHFILGLSLLYFLNVQAQITSLASYTISNLNSSTGTFFYTIKLNNSGYKYVVDDHSNKTLKLYNTNHTLFSSINVPIPSSITTGYHVNYVSDNLFDLTNDIEYVVITAVSPTIYPKLFIFKDNGSQLFFKDSATIAGSNNQNEVFYNMNGVYYDGISVKMKVGKLTLSTVIPAEYEIFSLPGVIPCVQCCSTGTLAGRTELGSDSENNPSFYPNPVTDQLKLKYTLPKDYKTAEIKIQDIQGKQLDSFKVTNDFEFIYLPSNYNNGLYLYSLIVDGQLIKTEKVILDK